jgi:hypothetical protein
MQYGNSKDMFRSYSPTSRHSRYAALFLRVSIARKLHRTFCMMDSSQRKVLKEWFDSHESITDAINEFAEYDEVFSEL